MIDKERMEASIKSGYIGSYENPVLDVVECLSEIDELRFEITRLGSVIEHRDRISADLLRAIPNIADLVEGMKKFRSDVELLAEDRS